MSHKWEQVYGFINTIEVVLEGKPVKIRQFYLELEHEEQIYYSAAQVPQEEADAHPEQVLMLFENMVERIEANITEKELERVRND